MTNKRTILLILWVTIAQASAALAQSPREMIVEMELECYSDQLDQQGTIGWQDVCYTWQETNVAQDNFSRVQKINDSLDALEGKPPQAAAPQRKNLDYFQQPARDPGLDEVEREKQVQSWLKEEYPYFYDEYREKQDEIYHKNDLTESGIYPWIKNIDYGMVIETDQKLQFYFENTFPLFQSEDHEHTFFSQDRLSIQSGDDPSLSLGVGYRHYDKKLNQILGGNMFWDYQKEHGHSRLGLGGELINSFGELRLNYYNGLSEAKSHGHYLEQAVDGMDFEIGTQVPGAPLAKIFAGYQWYNMKHSEDERGWTARLQLKPVKFFAVNLKAIDENVRERIYRVDGTVNFDFSSFALADLKLDLQGSGPADDRPDLREHLLDRVEREFNIRLERWESRLADDPSQPPPPPPPPGPDFRLMLEVRFPGLQCGDCDDLNFNGTVDPDEGWELDIVVENLSIDGTLTGMSASEIVISDTLNFADINSSPHVLVDIGPGQTVRTDIITDYDVTVNPAAAANDSTFITIDFTVNGETESYTFGPFVLGMIANGQQYLPN